MLSRPLAMGDASNPDDVVDLASTINMPRVVRKKGVPPKKVLMDVRRVIPPRGLAGGRCMPTS